MSICTGPRPSGTELTLGCNLKQNLSSRPKSFFEPEVTTVVDIQVPAPVYCLRRVLPCLALPCLALPCLALPCLALLCLALPCLVLFLFLSCRVLSCLVLSSLVCSPTYIPPYRITARGASSLVFPALFTHAYTSVSCLVLSPLFCSRIYLSTTANGASCLVSPVLFTHVLICCRGCRCAGCCLLLCRYRSSSCL